MSDIIEILSPLNDDDGSKAIFKNWLKNIGEFAKADDPIAEIETDKVTLEIVAPEDGVLTETFFQDGDNVPKEALVAKFKPSLEETLDDSSKVEKLVKNNIKNDIKSIANPEIETKSFKHIYSPAVRKLLADHQLNGDDITATGRDNRLTKIDVLNHIAKPIEVKKAPNVPTLQPVMGEKIPHTNMRKSIAHHMKMSVTEAPHVTAIFEADLSNIIAHRKANKADFAAKGVNLSMSAYFIEAAAKAIAHVPKVNSKWHEEFLEIMSDINIGMGTALGDEGLIVPVIHHVDQLNLFGIAKKLQENTLKAKDNKLTSNDLKGGTFTISNHGTSGSLVATPIIINQPQSAILGIGKMEKRVKVIEVSGQDVIAIKPMCYVSLTIDHRVLDGFQTNMFLTKFVELIDNWPLNELV